MQSFSLWHLLALSGIPPLTHAFCGQIYTDTHIDPGCTLSLANILKGDCTAIGGQPTECIQEDMTRRYLWCDNVPVFHGPYDLHDPFSRTVTIYSEENICRVCTTICMFFSVVVVAVLNCCWNTRG
ncbi:unnamed protein product [Cercospora beticola]|nr:unnamed protein product [Cercospora beticola]